MITKYDILNDLQEKFSKYTLSIDENEYILLDGKMWGIKFTKEILEDINSCNDMDSREEIVSRFEEYLNYITNYRNK